MHPLRRTIVVKYLMVLPVSSRSTCPVVLLGWLECGRAAGEEGESIGSGALSQLRVSTLPRAMFVPARGERKNGPASAFSAIISSGAKDKDATRLSDCAARRLSIHASVNAMPAPHLRGEFGKNKNNKNSHKSSILLASCAESCTPSSRWMRFFLLSPRRSTPAELLSRACALSGAFAWTEPTAEPVDSLRWTHSDSQHAPMSG